MKVADNVSIGQRSHLKPHPLAVLGIAEEGLHKKGVFTRSFPKGRYEVWPFRLGACDYGSKSRIILFYNRNRHGLC